MLERFREDLTGRVLEIGCGAGRVTGHLAALSDDVHAVDISPAMVDAARGAYPSVAFAVGDLRDLSGFADESFDALTAWCGVIDILPHAERQHALAEFARILRPGGLLVLDVHNLAHAPARRKPTDLPADSARQRLRSAAGLPVTLYRHRRLSRLEQTGDGYAVLNDEAHHFMALHYYVARDEQQRQLDAAGFDLLATIDREGTTLGPGEGSPRSADLHYVARRCCDD